MKKNIKQQMYAVCVNNTNVIQLEVGKEYRVMRVARYKNFGEGCFYILDDRRAYASCHFSVTYTK